MAHLRRLENRGRRIVLELRFEEAITEAGERNSEHIVLCKLNNEV